MDLGYFSTTQEKILKEMGEGTFSTVPFEIWLRIRSGEYSVRIPLKRNQPCQLPSGSPRRAEELLDIRIGVALEASE